jgi:hypothetical protein
MQENGNNEGAVAALESFLDKRPHLCRERALLLHVLSQTDPRRAEHERIASGLRCAPWPG